MRRINLLPWREMRRRQHRREFGLMVLGALGLAVVAVGIVHLYLATRMQAQEARNDYLQRQIASQRFVEQELEAMARTRQQIIGRMDIIRDLQLSRPEMVRVLDELVRLLPEDVFLTSLSTEGNALLIAGVARGNILVSQFMRMLRGSEHFGEPRLSEITNEDMSGERVSVFQLRAGRNIPLPENQEAEQ